MVVVGSDRGGGAASKPAAPGPQGRAERSPPGTIPIHTRPFLESFVREHAGRLHRRGVSLCWCMGVTDFVEDAVGQTIIRLMARGRPIADYGPDSALRYAMRVLRGVCVDEGQRRVRERVVAPTRTDDGVAGADDMLARLARELSPELAAAVDAQLAARASVLCFEYLPVYTDPAYRSAGRNLQACWLACVEGLDDARVAQALGIPKTNRAMRTRGQRHLLGWLSALCGQGSRPSAEPPTLQAAWQIGFEAARAFLEETPEWLPLPSRLAAGVGDGD